MAKRRKVDQMMGLQHKPSLSDSNSSSNNIHRQSKSPGLGAMSRGGGGLRNRLLAGRKKRKETVLFSFSPVPLSFPFSFSSSPNHNSAYQRPKLCRNEYSVQDNTVVDAILKTTTKPEFDSYLLLLGTDVELIIFAALRRNGIVGLAQSPSTLLLL
jgi:hypothetical protein